MNIGEVAISKRTVTLVLTLVAAVAGMLAYGELGRLEDPEFTIKEAMIVTPYPGASATDVEREVTNEIEKAVQQLGQLKRVESRSTRGLSIVQAVMKDEFDRNALPQVWDELRRKVKGAQLALPPGAGPSIVDDDFGDVYGVYVGITGEGYSYRELKEYVDTIRKELLLVQDVKRVVLWGVQPETIYVEMQRDRMASLGITQEEIFAALQAKNLAADGGRVRVGSRYVAIDPTGDFGSEQQFRGLLISEPGAAQLVRLGDVANVVRGYADPPESLLRMNYKVVSRQGQVLTGGALEDIDLADPALDVDAVIGEQAIGLAISTVQGGNVVTMGEALERRLAELESLRPVGMEVTVISLQSESVTKAVNNFIVNLAEAIAIVVVVLLFFMGARSGLLIGFILFVTIAATFIVMDANGIMLQRISLGALIIALGMLVDNAIVVTEGMQIRIEGGEDPRKAARDVVGQNQWPLLGATCVAIIAFAAIGVSKNDTGEFCRSLFQVLLISLGLSWVTAVTVTPLLCAMLFKPKQKAADGAEEPDPYAGGLFQGYRRVLELAMRMRWATITIVIGLFGLAIAAFGFLPDSFFPASGRPQYKVDLWMPEGTHIRETEAAAAELERYVMSLDNTHSAATHVGAGGARFLLVYTPLEPNSAYAQLIVNVFDPKGIDADRGAIEHWAKQNLPQALTFAKRFNIGPGKNGNVQLRFSGPEPEVLWSLAEEASEILHADPATKYVRNDWNQPVPVIRPVLAEAQASRNGITRTQVAARLAASFEGLQVGSFRDGTGSGEDRLIPVVSRPPAGERQNVDNLHDLQIYSPAGDRMIPLRQVVSGFETVFENEVVRRRNRQPTMTLHVDQTSGETADLWNRVAPKVEAAFAARRESGEISSEYALAWGGEHEDSAEAIGALAGSIPMFIALMVLIVIALFNNLRQPLIIWLTVPLALIGVAFGLLAFGQPFGFMALLGSLSLSGMLIKNAIVLIDQINTNLGDGMEPYDAIVNSGVSRMRPVMMAAATTVLGMIPLLGDVFFVGLAIAVMFGLTFATVLTLIFVPTLYATLFGIPSPAPGSAPIRGGKLAQAAAVSLLAVACVASQGCTVGPNYAEPVLDAPDRWQQESTRGLASGESNVETWWRLFEDPKLDDLIRRAVEGNPDLREAAARVAAGRAERGMATGEWFPAADARGSVTRVEVSEALLPAAIDGSRSDTFYSAGIDASWEIDVFGRIRRSVEAADARLGATVEDYRDVLVVLLAEVAFNYVELRSLQERIVLAEANAETQARTLSLTQDRRRAGIVPELDVRQAELNLARTRSVLPLLESQRVEAENRLAVLLGLYPGALRAELGSRHTIPAPPERLTVRVPAEMLRQRPDVRRAERELAARTADIGVATAELYPRFALLGTFAFDATQGETLFTGRNGGFAAGPSVRWNIFDGGRIRSHVRAREAFRAEQRAAYERIVLEAFEEVEGAMDAYVQESLRREELERSVAAAERAVELVWTLYRTGLSDFQNVQDTQRILFLEQDALSESRGFVARNMVRLYKALGGGWSVETELPEAAPTVDLAAKETS